MSGSVIAEVPSEVVELLEEYLASMYGPEPDPTVHLACCAPGALVLVGDRVERREDVAAHDYKDAVESALAARGAAERTGQRVIPVFEIGRALECVAAEDVAAILVSLREILSGRQFEAVFVLEDAGVLGGCVLEASRSGRLPHPHLAQAMVAAEFAQPPSGSGTDSCLTGLELSFDRVFGGTLSALGQFGPDRQLAPVVALCPPGALDLPLRWLPEARFSCAMCGESCRAAKWRNAVSDATRLALEAMPWHLTHAGRLPDALFRYPDDEDPDLWRGDVELGARPDGFCAFFDGERGCVVHGLLGRQPIPSCHQFPYAFTRTPDGVDVWTTFHCQASLDGHGIPPEDREADIRSRLWATRTPQRWIGREVALGPELVVSWHAYRAIETALLDFLDLADPSPIAGRLQAAEGFVQEAIAAADRGPALADPGLAPADPGLATADRGLDPAKVAELARQWRDAPRLSRPPSGSPDPLVAGLVAGLYKRYPPLAGRLPLPDEAIGTWLGHLPPPEWEWPERLLARYLRHTIFHKHFLLTEGGLFTWRMALLSWAVVRLYTWSLACFEREGLLTLEQPPIQKAIQDNDRLLIHAGTYFARFLKGYPAEYERLMGTQIAAALIWS